MASMESSNTNTINQTPINTNQPTPSSPTIPNPPIVINAHAQIPIKLTPTNFPAWHIQFHSLLVGFDLLGFVDGTFPCPEKFMTAENSTSVLNPEHSLWIRQDKLLLNAIVSSLSPNLVSFIAAAQTSREAWVTINNTYARPSRGRIMHLKSALGNLHKGDTSITEYMHGVKSIVDSLSLMNSSPDPDELVLHILRGLGSEFNGLSEAVRARDTSITFDELHEKLVTRESQLQPHSSASSSPFQPVTANFVSRNPTATRPHHNSRPTSSPQHRTFPTNSRSRSSSNSNFAARPYLGKCQLCGEQGHSAKRYTAYRYSPVNSSSTPASQPRHHQANLAAHSSASPPQDWLLDSGASHHITNDLGNLSLHSTYSGLDDVQIGDGNGLHITHIGNTHFQSRHSKFLLSNILCVPRIARNLVSVSQFCSQNNTSIEFLPDSFVVKNLQTGTPLLRGPVKDGVYALSFARPAPVSAFSSTSTSLDTWHLRLGHPNPRILRHLASSKHLSLLPFKHSLSNCNSCDCNKSHKLPFSTSTVSSSTALQIVFSDLWTSPIISTDGYKYYVVFIDHFTKYVWLYPLKKKSDVRATFVRFRALVENFFNASITTLFTDNGGEYVALTSYLSENGISHLTTPPHTPEHNGYAEWRHRHVVETGLALLQHASIPTNFWPYAFTTATYLINRLPKINLHYLTSYEKLYQSAPNFSKLRVFGCLCYPWLRPYTSHKLDSRSKPCVFLGYSLSQSAYHCLHISTGRVYTSRHVKFVEHVFPFATSPSPSPSSDASAPLFSSSPVATTSGGPPIGVLSLPSVPPPAPVHSPLPSSPISGSSSPPSPDLPPDSLSASTSSTLPSLKDKDVSIIGICGMPGVGKTTMANEIANEVKVDKLFDEVAISVVSHDPDVTKIQDQLADMLGLKIEEKNNIIVRAGRLRERLGGDRSKSILVILDDVWEYIELETIGIPSSGDDKGLKILLTSRFKDVCSNMGAQRKFDVDVLSREESWELFKGNAEISDYVTDVIKGTAQKVASECKGLPLALVTVGKALRKRGEHAWKNALEELRHSRVANIKGLHKLVYSRIEFSYNYLESDEAKSLLLQCSLFPEDFALQTEDLVRYAWGLELFRDTRTLITTRDRVNSIVDDLRNCYLLLSTGIEECVRLHDVVRVVCLQIASKGRHAYMSKHTGLKEWPKHDNNESYNAMNLTLDELNQLPSGLEYPNLKFLAVDGKGKLLNISKDFFADMKELRVLDFTSMRIQIPSSIQLFTNLRTLCLDHCTLNIEIASIGNLKKLEVLSFYGSDLDHFPNDIAELSNLRSLDLRLKHSSTYCPLPPGTLLQLKKLEELYMGVVEIRDDELEQRGYIIKEISSLTGLNAFQISTNDPQFLLQILPILCIENLERFNIIVLTDLEHARKNRPGNYYFKRRLHIHGITYSSMLSQPAMNSLMRRTEHLSIEMDMNNLDDHSLQVMERNNMLDEDGFEYLNRNHQLGAFDRLQEINLYGIPRMKYLWRGVIKPPSLHNLMILNMGNCPLVTSMLSESVARCMVNLQSISISNCEMLGEIVLMDIQQNEVTQMLEFPKLRNVALGNLRNFKSFRSGSNKIDGVLNPLFEQVTLPNLEFLRLHQLDCTVKLLDELRQIRSDKLKELAVGYLDDVSILFDFEYTKDDAEISMLTQLKSLIVAFLPKLVQFTRMLPKGIDIFENLTRLQVSNCDSLRYLFSPSMANSLVALKEMRVMFCKAVEEIIGRQEEDDTSNVEIVEEGITNRIVFPKLSGLTLFRLDRLRLLSSQNYELVFPSLEYLRIEKCPVITKLGSRQLNAPKLDKVWISQELSIDISDFFGF